MQKTLNRRLELQVSGRSGLWVARWSLKGSRVLPMGEVEE